MREGAHDFLFKHSLGRLGAVLEREKKEAAMRAERRRMQQQLLLADRLSSVGMLAAGVAHEINNPLAYVLGNLEFALNHLEGLEGLGKGEFAEVLQALTQAREGSERIRVTTRDLKVFCRTDEDVRTSVNVRRVMESSINIAWNEIRHRAQLVRRFDAVPPIAGNENRFGAGVSQFAGQRRAGAARQPRRTERNLGRHSFGRGQRDHRNRRHGDRHRAREAQTRVRPFLHHQARGNRQRYRPFDLPEHHQRLGGRNRRG